MKAVILLAGLGTRMRPLTYSKPKPLVLVAGKTVLGHILDSLKDLDISEYIFVVGYLGEQIEKFIAERYPRMQARFVEQKEAKGQSQAIQLARQFMTEPTLVIFGDTIWEADLTRLDRVQGDGLIFVKEVADPRRFGIAYLKDGYAVKMVEKPQNTDSKLAIVGVYYFRNQQRLLAAIDEQIAKNVQTKNEFFLADAVQLMLNAGAKMEVETIPVWEDCGTRDAILQTNRYLLNKNGNHSQEYPGSVILPPVYISHSARITNSILGPYVSISSNALIENSIIRDSIIGEGAYIDNRVLEWSLVGNDALVRGSFQRLNVGDSSEIDTGGIEKNGH